MVAVLAKKVVKKLKFSKNVNNKKFLTWKIDFESQNFGIFDEFAQTYLQLPLRQWGHTTENG